MNTAAVHAIMSGRDRRVRACLLRTATALAEPGYRLGVSLRNRAFDTGRRKAHRLPGKVISVGNITTGGTGKTPMVAQLVERLCRMGRHPAVLMRGYMPKPGTQSDEQAVLTSLLHAMSATGDPVAIVCNRDRVAGARQARAQQPRADVFILDDGFQHRQVHRDLDLVLIDATEPLGFGRLLPRGLLREPAENLHRADAVVVTRADQAENLPALERQIEQLHGKAVMGLTAHVWVGYQVGLSDQQAELTVLRDQTVAVAVGIGNPDAFVRSAETHVAGVVAQTIYPDHYPFTHGDLVTLMQQARQAGAQAVLTSEKDWVKWQPLLAGDASLAVLPIYRPRLCLQWLRGSDALDDLLKQVMA